MWHRMCHKLANETVLDRAALWRFVRVRFGLALGVIVAGVLIALVEIRLGVTEGKASYVYLLMLGIGVMKPMFSRDRAEAPEP